MKNKTANLPYKTNKNETFSRDFNGLFFNQNFNDSAKRPNFLIPVNLELDKKS